MGKCILGNANGRDLNNLKNSLQMLPTIKSLLNNLNSNYLKQLNEKILLIPELTDLIEQAIKEDPPISIRDGGIIRDGYNGDIDELRSITRDCKNWMADFEAKERESTGIKSLKIGYNKVFGYYIEITKSNFSSVPQYYVRKQTLANGERYITSELKEIENKILGAEEKLLQLEYQQFSLVRDEVLNYLSVIKTTAKQIGELDVLLSFALTALNNNYSKPILEIGKALEIRDSRHPVVENTIKDSLFVPNDCYMDSDRNRLLIITGPNMAGKSTYMRQIALNIILAQIGSFVPSSYCKVGIIDRIFTRIGATDDLSTGQSTFMVEMNEVSHILKNVTPNSFIILDEVGRGTSTFDGLSIAQAIIEYIVTSMPKGSKTLFATHYHELTMLEDTHPGIRNFRVAVKEEGRTIKFLHRIIPGGADKSYGIHVCQLAGLPRPLIKRAFEILDILESQKLLLNKEVLPKNIETKEGQIAFEEIASTALVKELSKIDPITVTPIEAINILFKIQGEAKKIVEGGF
jgi:DNA mismatch repair protein MutS